MAQGAVSAIRSGCEMLREGKAEIGKFKQTIEQGVGDAKAIYNEVTGLWGWLSGLFGAKPTPSIKPVPAKQVNPMEHVLLVLLIDDRRYDNCRCAVNLLVLPARDQWNFLL